MVDLIKFSLRNVLRNKRRSILTLSIVAISFLVLSLLKGYIASQKLGWKQILIHGEYGHFQIFNRDYQDTDSTSFKTLISDSQFQKIKQILSSTPEIQFFSPRLNFSGLVGTSSTTKIYVGTGRSTSEGPSLYYTDIVKEGSQILDEKPFGILMGYKLAQTLKVKINDRVLVMGTSQAGSMEAMSAAIVGLSKTYSQLDDMGIIMRVEDAKELLLAKGYHSVVVLLKNDNELNHTINHLMSTFNKLRLPLKILSFDQLAMFYSQVIQMYERYFLISSIILSILIVFSLSNTIYMTITERTREFAVLRTIGLFRRTIFISILLEGLIIGFAGIMIGFLLSYGLHSVINGVKITLPPPPGSSDRIPFSVVFDYVENFKIGILFVVVALSASVLPAWQVIRMNILKGLNEGR